MIETSELEQKATASNIYFRFTHYTLGYEIFISEYDQYMDGI